jgi:hypothetical protein
MLRPPSSTLPDGRCPKEVRNFHCCHLCLLLADRAASLCSRVPAASICPTPLCKPCTCCRHVNSRKNGCRCLCCVIHCTAAPVAAAKPTCVLAAPSQAMLRPAAPCCAVLFDIHRRLHTYAVHAKDKHCVACFALLPHLVVQQPAHVAPPEALIG